MLVKLWGARGSLPAPLTNKEYKRKIHRIIKRTIESGIDSSQISNFIKNLPEELKYTYGGNTTCVTVTSNIGEIYILDCGSGLRPLGDELMKGPCGQGKGNLNIFLTHNHWDHISGLPFFKPIMIPGNVLNFYSPYKDQKKILTLQQKHPYFPATFDQYGSTKKFHNLKIKNRTPIQLEDDLTIDYYPLKHPGGSFAYRFRQGDKTFIFATDAEFTGETIEQVGEQTDFFMDADLLVLDSQYTLQESFTKIAWGHTSYTMAVNCGIRWNIKNLVLTHHEPTYSDLTLYENYIKAIEHGKHNNNTTTKIYMAREGMTFKI